MAAHVFDSSEPAFDTTTTGEAPLFAAQPEVFRRIQGERRRTSPVMLAGVAIAALAIGGVVYATSNGHHQFRRWSATSRETRTAP